MDKPKISNYQMAMIFIAFMTGSTIVVNPSIGAKQDAWFAFILSWAGGVLLIFFNSFTASVNPSKTIYGIFTGYFGKIFGKILCVLYILYFIDLPAGVLRTFGEFSATLNYSESPMIFVLICFCILVAYTLKSGIEAAGRISEIFILLFILVSLATTVSTAYMFDKNLIRPFLSNGWAPVLKSSYETLILPFGESVVFLAIFTNANKQKSVIKYSVLSMIFFGFFLLNIIIRNLLVIGPDMAARQVFTSRTVFTLVPAVNIAPLLDIVFILVGIIKVWLCIYAACIGISELFNTPDYKVFVLPVTVIVLSLSIWIFENYMDMIQWNIKVWILYSIPFQLVIPFILFIMSIVKKHRLKSKNAYNTAENSA